MHRRPIHSKEMLCERCLNTACSEQGRYNPFMGNGSTCDSYKGKDATSKRPQDPDFTNYDFSKWFHIPDGLIW